MPWATLLDTIHFVVVVVAVMAYTFKVTYGANRGYEHYALKCSSELVACAHHAAVYRPPPILSLVRRGAILL